MLNFYYNKKDNENCNTCKRIPSISWIPRLFLSTTKNELKFGTRFWRFKCLWKWNKRCYKGTEFRLGRLKGRRPIQEFQRRVEASGKIIQQLAAIFVIAVRHEAGRSKKQHKHRLQNSLFKLDPLEPSHIHQTGTQGKGNNSSSPSIREGQVVEEGPGSGRRPRTAGLE